MLREAIEYVFGLGEKSKAARVVEVKGSPAHRVLIQHNDKMDWQDLQPQPRHHTAKDLSAIIDFAEQNPAACRVWFDRTGVSCVLDDATRRDTIAVSLKLSEQILHLGLMSREKASMRQKDLILLLRTVFHGCLGPAGEFLNTVRKLKFIKNNEGQSTIAQGKVSVGRKIENEVTGAETIPESINVCVPIFASGFVAVGTVQIVIDVDPETETFKLIPVTQSIEQAITKAEMEIREHLREHLPECQIHFGSP